MLKKLMLKKLMLKKLTEEVADSTATCEGGEEMEEATCEGGEATEEEAAH